MHSVYGFAVQGLPGAMLMTVGPTAQTYTCIGLFGAVEFWGFGAYPGLLNSHGNSTYAQHFEVEG